MKLIKHEKTEVVFNPYFYHHKATVEVDPSEDSGTEEEFVFQVACLAGYHPAGYDMLFPRVKELGGGIYQVEWESAKHSD